MMKTELKVHIHSQKSKIKVMQAVTKLTGVDEVSVDSEKGILTVVGNVDPVKVVTQIRKTGNSAEIVSVGPPKKPDEPKKPDKEEEKPSPPPPPPPPPPLPCHCNQCQPPWLCNQCQLVAVGYAPYDDGACSIL